MDADTNDITGNGLSNCVTRDGQSAATANLPMGGFKHTGIADGTARNQYTSLGQLQDGAALNGGTSSGTNTITFNMTPTITAYATGQSFSFVAGGTNTSAATININGVGAKNVTKRGTTALVAGDILINSVYFIEYDGTQFQLINPSDATPATNSITNAMLAQMATKTIKSNITGGTANAADNTISDTLDAQLGTTQGTIAYRNGTVWTAVGPGTTGQLLKSTGAASNPIFDSIATILDTISSTQGTILYRNNTTWVTLAPGTSGQYLQTLGAGANPAWASPGLVTYDSGNQTITSGGTLSLTHSLGGTPKIVQVRIKNLSSEMNYSVGDELMVNYNASTYGGGLGNYGLTVIPGTSSIFIRFGNQTGLVVLADKNTGAVATAIDNTKWALIVRAYA